MLNVKLKDKIHNTTIMQRTRVTDIVQYKMEMGWTHRPNEGWWMDCWKHRVADRGCKIGRKTGALLER